MLDLSDWTIDELRTEAESVFLEIEALDREKVELQRNWMVEDEDGDWEQCLDELKSYRERLDQITKEIDARSAS